MSEEIKITLPNGSVINARKGQRVYDVIGAIGAGLQKAAVAARLDDTDVDLSYTVTSDANLIVHTFKTPEGKEIFWHSGSHLMAQAVKRLFPSAKLAIGPAIDMGFYYDFDLEHAFTPEDLERIEAEMKKIVTENLELTREDMKRSDAIELFSKMGETYKVELLKELAVDTVSIYRQGEFVDLCRGPHVSRTSTLAAFKLLNIAGAYWRGDEKNRMLQRIYGVTFPDAKQLAAHLEFLEEAKKRDHRKLGRELDLFSIHEETGPGLILWHPYGGRLRNSLENFWRQEHIRNGYDLVYSPHIGRSNLWETSGHLGFYRENMYSSMDVDGQEYFVKPMNCPFHIMMYKNRGWSYRDLPLRWAELGTVYRYERSGVLHGLLRVRGFTQDDAHLFVRPDQMPAEIDRVLAFCLYMLRSFGFQDFKLYLATKPKEKSVGDDQRWNDATIALEEAIKRAGIEYDVDEGGGAFYGPKIDIKIRDAIGREWQCSTIQFDFNMPDRFDVTYVGSDGAKHRPYMIHRALFGSLERFIGVLIEHYSGKFPVWLAPVQAIVINVSEEQSAAVDSFMDTLRRNDIRVESDTRNESMGYRIRDAIGRKVPYVAVLGKKEVDEKTVSVRKRGEEKSVTMTQEDFMALVRSDIEKRL